MNCTSIYNYNIFQFPVDLNYASVTSRSYPRIFFYFHHGANLNFSKISIQIDIHNSSTSRQSDKKVAMSKKNLVLGTGNADKIAEITLALMTVGLNMDVRSIKEYDPNFNPYETGETLLDNALIKSREAARITGEWTAADDTGLFIDALGGAPGVYSSRYAGEDASYANNRNKALKALEGIPRKKRTARFRCVIALTRDGIDEHFEGAVEGVILDHEIGEKGFGYDSIFFCLELNKTFAEADVEEKNRVSHRGRAVKALAERLKKLIS
jgi:XTP/dITP diphosphohydrolase